MSSEAIMFPSFDGTPEVLGEVPKLWSEYGLNMAVHSPDPTADDYERFLADISEQVEAKFTQEEKTTDLVGFSNGGKIALSLLARHPDQIGRVVICNTKIKPYGFTSPATRIKLPNLAKTSDILEQDFEKITSQMLERVLCFRSEEDDVLDHPDDAYLVGAHNIETPTKTHASGLEYVARNCGLVTAQFLHEGIVPTSV